MTDTHEISEATPMPMCMMPDGAEPCKGYSMLLARLSRVERERDALKEALFRLRAWGMDDNYSASVVADLRDWIDGGMGQLPALHTLYERSVEAIRAREALAGKAAPADEGEG